MIIREQEDAFVLYRQNDHARLSGDAARQLKADLFLGEDYTEDTVFAIYEHDCAWIGLDETPIWHDAAARPFSFDDYPLVPKLHFYKQGIDDIQRKNRYAALLCSRHFAAFFQTSQDEPSLAFLLGERERQQAIRQTLRVDEHVADRHFQLLQLCDDLSLYVCMNEPGATKEQEHPWFKDGFSNSGLIYGDPDRLVQARWLDKSQVALEPFPLERETEALIPFKRVPKSAIAQQGIAEAYEAAPWEHQRVRFVDGTV